MEDLTPDEKWLHDASDRMVRKSVSTEVLQRLVDGFCKRHAGPGLRPCDRCGKSHYEERLPR